MGVFCLCVVEFFYAICLSLSLLYVNTAPPVSFPLFGLLPAQWYCVLSCGIADTNNSLKKGEGNIALIFLLVLCLYTRHRATTAYGSLGPTSPTSILTTDSETHSHLNANSYHCVCVCVPLLSRGLYLLISLSLLQMRLVSWMAKPNSLSASASDWEADLTPLLNFIRLSLRWSSGSTLLLLFDYSKESGLEIATNCRRFHYCDRNKWKGFMKKKNKVKKRCEMIR